MALGDRVFDCSKLPLPTVEEMLTAVTVRNTSTGVISFRQHLVTAATGVLTPFAGCTQPGPRSIVEILGEVIRRDDCDEPAIWFTNCNP